MSSWDDVRPLIQKALDADEADMTAEDVVQMILDGEAQLWGDKKNGVVTTIQFHEGRKLMMLWLCWGDINGVVDLHQGMEVWAKIRECAAMACIPFRPAWRRVLAPLGYEPVGYWLEREIDVRVV